MSGGSFSASGRGWSDRALLLAGVAVLAILGLVTGLLLAKSKGYLEDTVKVDAQLMNVGDGLPERADVKFRGMLVGAVTSVTPAEDGKPNIVHIDLKSEHAGGIPSTVTARVVPTPRAWSRATCSRCRRYSSSTTGTVPESVTAR